MDSLTVAEAVREDLPAMVALLAELFALESDFAADPARQMAGLGAILDSPESGRLFVLRAGAEVVGMANALIVISTAEGGRVLLLEDVIVRQSHRGAGAGRLLVEHILAWAGALGMRRVTLLADQANAPALAFYRRLGFEVSAMTVLRKHLP